MLRAETPRGGGPSSATARVVRIVTGIELAVAATACAVLFLLILIQVGQRYLPVAGWTWTGELARYCLVWLTFSAAGVLVTRDGHIALKVVDSVPSQRVVRAVRALAMAIVAVIGAGFAWSCWSLIENQHNLTTPSLGMPVAYVYAIPLAGFISTTVRAMVAAVELLRHGEPAGESSESLATEAPGEGSS